MPLDKSKWHPAWKLCHPTWKSNFPDFEHKVWGDTDIDFFVKENFPEFFDVYDSFLVRILKIDFARMCILYKYGGIYADMDMYCYRNFYNDLKDGVNLVQSNGIRNVDCNEEVQNSLMACNEQQVFVIDCMNEICDRYLERENSLVTVCENMNNIPALRHFYSEIILQISGPTMLSDVYERHDNVNVLPRELYNPSIYGYTEDIKTKHMMTGLWDSNEKIDDEKMKSHYKSFRGIDLDRFVFNEEYK